jgi:hypothetical protein
MSKTSSATRLYTILNNALKQGSEQPVTEVWATVLGATSNKQQDVSEKLSELIGLINDVKIDIRQLELDDTRKNQYLQSISRIQSVIIGKGLTDLKWATIQGLITEDNVVIISALGHVMESGRVGQISVSQQQTQSLLEKVQSLIQEFRNSELPDDIKLDLIKELRKIEDALINFEIRGEINLKKVSDAVYGEILIKLVRIPEQYRMKAGKVLELTLILSALVGAVEKTHYLPDLLNNSQQVIEDISISKINNILEGSDELIDE